MLSHLTLQRGPIHIQKKELDLLDMQVNFRLACQLQVNYTAIFEAPYLHNGAR